jgi:hypothetical protein
MGEKPKIVYRPATGASPETERAALAAVYAFVLERHNKVARTGPDGGAFSLPTLERRSLDDPMSGDRQCKT